MKLDFRRFADGCVVSAADIEAQFKRIGHELQPLESWGSTPVPAHAGWTRAVAIFDDLLIGAGG